MSLLSFIARQRSSLLVIFLVLLALTLYKELESAGEETVLFVTEKNKEVTGKRIFELKVTKNFKESPDDLESEVSVNKTEKQKGESIIGKISPRCHFRAPLENRFTRCSWINKFSFLFCQNGDLPLRPRHWFHINREKCLQNSTWQPALLLRDSCLFSGLCFLLFYCICPSSELFCQCCCRSSLACLVLLPRKSTV